MKIAIVGCGQIADAHIQEARKLPGIEVAAVCDANVHMAKQAAVRFGIPGTYTSLAKMLGEVRPEVVHITTPPATHLLVGKSVVELGSHAYIEKPFTLNRAEAEELIDVATRVGKLVCVGHNYVYDNSFVRLKALHQAGKLGEIRHVDAVMGYNLAGNFGSVFMGDPTHWLHKLPGGLAQNNISHPLSLMLEFLRDQNPYIHACGFRLREQTYGDVRDLLFDELRVFIRGERTTGNLVFSCSARPVQLYIVVYGTRGQATVSLDSRTLKVVEGSSLPQPFQKVHWAQNEAREVLREYLSNLGKLVNARLHFFEGMKELFYRFYRAIEGKGEMPIAMSEALRTTAIMDDIFQQCNANDPALMSERVSV
ncbi:MAG TPA: Gfo/Idh/MocA family oxidoreductase [Nitrospiraceae bacterium]|nr:Gfo/Idh/MocA family oxidoreductase [Nitrospiraceae bacterium]